MTSRFTAITTSQRSSAVITFNTTPDVKGTQTTRLISQVIFMKTELAAYGINLVAANYVFILDPVWDASKEAQVG